METKKFIGKVEVDMGSKGKKLGVALIAGAGAAAYLAKKSKDKEKKKNEVAVSEYRNTERGKQRKNKKGIYYSNGNYEAFARRKSHRGWRKNRHTLWEVALPLWQQPVFW